MIGKGLDYEHAMCVCFGSDFDGGMGPSVWHVLEPRANRGALSLLGLGTI